MKKPHIWIVEMKHATKGWIPHPHIDWCDTKKEALNISRRDVETRSVRYERVQ